MIGGEERLSSSQAIMHQDRAKNSLISNIRHPKTIIKVFPSTTTTCFEKVSKDRTA